MKTQVNSDIEHVLLDCAVVGRSQLSDGKQLINLLALNKIPPTIVYSLEFEQVEGEFYSKRDVLARPIDYSKWPPRVQEAFNHERLRFTGDLCTMTEKALLRHRGIAGKTILNICSVLSECGLRLGMKLPWWEDFRRSLPDAT